jgi:hypothetical protein
VATISCHGPLWAAGATSLNVQTDHESERGDAATVLICDKLTMLVTGDPVTELDSALNYAARRLREAGSNGDDASAASLGRMDRRSARRTAHVHCPRCRNIAGRGRCDRPSPRHPGRLTCSTNTQSESVTAPRRSMYDRQWFSNRPCRIHSNRLSASSCSPRGSRRASSSATLWSLAGRLPLGTSAI